MAFRESPVFPDTLSLGSHGGPLFRTQVVAARSGAEQRNQAWSQPLAVYEVGLVTQEALATNALRRFFRSIAMGRRHGFRLLDRLPGEATGFWEVLGVGDGVTTAYQLVKHYPVGGYETVRTITKPAPGTTRIRLDTPETGAFTVDTTTGMVTMTSAPAVDVTVRAWFQFHVPVRFDTDHLDITAIEPGLFSWPSIRLVETRLFL